MVFADGVADGAALVEIDAKVVIDGAVASCRVGNDDGVIYKKTGALGIGIGYQCGVVDGSVESVGQLVFDNSVIVDVPRCVYCVELQNNIAVAIVN